MDSRFVTSRDDLNCIHMELKQLQLAQGNHAERLLRLERRQADDAAIKAAWSPFPGVLAATPQHGPISMPPDDDDLDEYGNDLMSSLHLPPAEEEPVRRGAASRANSVRFDESAIHGSGWGGQSTRHSGEFVRPGSGLSMERSFSHKSDGRHSSAGHSVHSAPSVGRASSIGGDASFVGDHDDDSPLSIPEPPPSLSLLGSVPSIIRCWLTTKFVHDALLYADVCTGSRRSTVEYSLLRALDITEDIETDFDGVARITLPVYLAEAIVTQQSTRSRSPSHEIHIPSMTVTFEVVGKDQREAPDSKGVRIFLGSDALRAYSADVLLSRNHVVLYGDDRSKLTVPFVRPEDENAFKHICTVNLHAEKLKLNAAAAPFVVCDDKGAAVPETIATTSNSRGDLDGSVPLEGQQGSEVSFNEQPTSPTTSVPLPKKALPSSMQSPHPVSESGHDIRAKEAPRSDASDGGRDTTASSNGTDGAPEARRDTSSGIWGSWRHGATNGTEGGQREGGLLSGYQPAVTGTRGRNMKVLKPLKSNSSARTGPSYEPPRGSGETGRRSGAGETGLATGPGTGRWDSKRTASVSSIGEKVSPGQGQQMPKDARAPGLPRSVNPVGGASAFSWMKKPTANGEGNT